MNIKPVSRPLDLSRGVSVTGGRPLPDVLVRRPEPLLDDDALALVVPVATPDRWSESIAQLATSVGSSPTRTGVQALAWLAWWRREAARKKYPVEASAEINLAGSLGNVCKRGTFGLDGEEGKAKRLAELYMSAYER